MNEVKKYFQIWNEIILIFIFYDSTKQSSPKAKQLTQHSASASNGNGIAQTVRTHSKTAKRRTEQNRTEPLIRWRKINI